MPSFGPRSWVRNDDVRAALAIEPPHDGAANKSRASCDQDAARAPNI